MCATSATMVAKLKKVASKLACWQVINWSCKLCQAMDSRNVGTQGTLALEHVSMLLGTSVCENARHVGM